jgi:HlyD family secretion protein
MTDILRKPQAYRHLIRRILYGGIILFAISGISWYVWRLPPAVPTVDRASVWIDTVKRGSIPRQVRGIGKLVSEEIRWITASTDGRVEKKHLEAGASITPDTVLLQLSNPQLQQEAMNAEWDWKAEHNSYVDLKVRLDRDRMNEEADMAKLELDYEQASLEYKSDSELHKDGLIPALTLKRDEVHAQQLANRLRIEKQRMEILKESIEAQLAERGTRIDQRHAMYALKKSQLDQLKVRAGVAGVLQELPVDIGQRVSPGTNLAHVANPQKLKAELNISATQAKDLQLGQEVSVDTGNGAILGEVSRIDPAVKNDTVTVDVRLKAELTRGARPDLSVTGTIVLDRLVDVLYTGRPPNAGEDRRISLFKLDTDGKRAKRVMVKLGRSSVDQFEIKEGLKPGDKIILSDMPEQDGYDSIRLN